MHASVIAYLIDFEVNQGMRLRETPIGEYMAHHQKGFEPESMDMSKNKESGKVAPAPIVSEGLHSQAAPSGPGLAGLLDSEHPQTAPEHPQPPSTAPRHVPPQTAAGPKHDSAEEVEKITERKDQVHT